jgi:hypothetical protein
VGDKKPTAGKERRETPRVAIALHAIVKLMGRPFQMFRTRDLSLEGTFIEIGPHRLTSADKLEVALKIPSHGVSQVYRFEARITRIAPNGIGMVFDHINTESYAALLECVFTANPERSA